MLQRVQLIQLLLRQLLIKLMLVLLVLISIILELRQVMPLWKLLIQMRNSAPGYATSTADNPFAGRNAVPPGNAGNE